MTQTARSADAILEIIRKFVVERSGEEPEELTLDTPLLESGLVDSFGLVDLGLEISRALEVPLLSGNLLPEDFETPRVLWNRIEEVCA